MAVLVVLDQVASQSQDARPCDNQDDCPTTLCCGWAKPLQQGQGFEHKICYKPNKEIYTNFNEESYSFQCDPAIEKMNFNAEEYSKRFWIGQKKDGPMNIPGYGPNRIWIPPIQTPDSIIEIFDRFQLTVLHGYFQPITEAYLEWASNFGTGDSWDGYWYNNAKASGDQLYPTGLNKYFDLHSLDGLGQYYWYAIWV